MSKKDDEWRREEILQAAREGTSVAGCARAGGISRETLYQWLNNEPDFSDRFERARSEGEQELVRKAKDKRPDWLLATSYGYKKTEKRELVGKDGGPIQKEVEVETKDIIEEYEGAFAAEEDNDENEG